MFGSAVLLCLATVIAVSGLGEAVQCSWYEIPPKDIIAKGCKALNAAKDYFAAYQGLCTRGGSGSCQWCSRGVCRGIVDNSVKIENFIPKGCSIRSLDASTGSYEGEFKGAELILTGVDNKNKAEFVVNMTVNMNMKFSTITNPVNNECYTNFTLAKIRRNPSASVVRISPVKGDLGNKPSYISRIGKYMLIRRLPIGMGQIVNDLFQRLSMKAATLKFSLALLQ